MKCYLIGYNINREEHDYSDFIIAMQELGKWWHYLNSIWIVCTDLSAEEIFNKLSAHNDTETGLLVIRLHNEAAFDGFDLSGTLWLKENLPRS